MKPELVANYWILGLLAICSVFGFGCSGIEQPVAAIVDNRNNDVNKRLNFTKNNDFVFQESISNRLIFLDDWKLYSINPDGSDKRRLLGNWDKITTFALSPSSRKFAIRSFKGKTPFLFIVNIDGTNPTSLIRADQVTGISWSPDENKLVYTKLTGEAGHNNTQSRDIYIIDYDGSNRTYIAEGSGASWSPDGRHILYQSSGQTKLGLNFDIYIINPDGTNRKNLSNNPAIDRAPSWTSEGNILFQSFRDAVKGDKNARTLYLMKIDGTSLTQLEFTYDGRMQTYSLSPKEDYIAYHFDREIIICSTTSCSEEDKVRISISDNREFIWGPN